VNLLKPYLLGTNFTVMTDCNALLTLKENANSKSRLMRWHLALQQFTFGIKHVKGEQNLGDIFARIFVRFGEQVPDIFLGIRF
jgi:hypothetical protein